MAVVILILFYYLALGVIVYSLVAIYKQRKKSKKDRQELDCYKQSYPTIEDLYQKIQETQDEYTEKIVQLENSYATKKANLLAQTNADILQAQETIHKQITEASAKYCNDIELTYKNLEDNFDSYKKDCNARKQLLENQIKDAEKELIELKETVNAGVQEQLREKQNKEKINFYKISINDQDLVDIHILNDIKNKIHNPTIVSKIIWSAYFQKRTTELCNRIVAPSPKKVCGIYKITNLITQQCYIGQSSDISSRFKEHIKCGLGIDAPSANKLYQSMQQDGVWNFSFEVIEECERDKLNEREVFWINFFQASIFGLNSILPSK